MTDRLEQRFRDTLLEVDQIIFDKMHETVDSNKPIAHQSWVTQYAPGKWCGCLMMDGYRQKKKAYERQHDWGHIGTSDYFVRHVLKPFYEGLGAGNVTEVDLLDVAYAYDQWVRANNYPKMTSMGSYIINNEGRIALRQIFHQVSLQRAHA